jgi:hypothetical protein
MALDYSKLSTEELEAIANDDYSRLSTETLNAIANDSGASKSVDTSAPTDPAEQALATQAIATAIKPTMNVAGSVIEKAVPAAKFIGTNAKDIYDVGRNLMGVQGSGWAQMATQPLKTAKAWAQGHPNYGPMLERAGKAMANQSIAGVAKEAAGAVPGLARQGVSALGQGALGAVTAPENLLALPYTMAGYEQEKIRANPTAPQYATNPYAQMTRGEAATQGAAGAANRRSAIGGQQYGGLTEAEQRMLESDRLNMAIRLKAAKKVLGQ